MCQYLKHCGLQRNYSYNTNYVNKKYNYYITVHRVSGLQGGYKEDHWTSQIALDIRKLQATRRRQRKANLNATATAIWKSINRLSPFFRCFIRYTLQLLGAVNTESQSTSSQPSLGNNTSVLYFFDYSIYNNP